MPGLGSFPEVLGANVTHIPHSPEVDELWAKSRVLRYGADFHIRLLEQGSPGAEEQFPVGKLAVNDRQRQFIRDEFEILRELSSGGTPVVRVHPEPFADDKGVFGFRMEKLLSVDLSTELDRGELVRCLEQMHDKGVVHNDFNFSNVMRDGEGKLVVIDFGRSGRVGSEVPKEKRPPWWRAESNSFEADYISLNRFFGTFETLIMSYAIIV